MNRETIRELLRIGKLDFLSDKEKSKIKSTGHLPIGFSVHHIRFKSLGGTNNISNLIVLKNRDHHSLHKHHDIDNTMKDVCIIYSDNYFKRLVMGYLDKKDKLYYKCTVTHLIKLNKNEYLRNRKLKHIANTYDK